MTTPCGQCSEQSGDPIQPAKIAVFTRSVDRESVVWCQDAQADGCMDSASMDTNELIRVLADAATGKQPISRCIADTLLRLTEVSQDEPVRLAVTATRPKFWSFGPVATQVRR